MTGPATNLFRTSLFLGTAGTGLAIAVTPNLALAGSAIASAHDETPDTAKLFGAANPAHCAGSKP